MPILLAEIGIPYFIVRIAGNERERHYLESLGLVPDTMITVISKFNNYVILSVKGSRIGIGNTVVKKVILKEVLA